MQKEHRFVRMFPTDFNGEGEKKHTRKVIWCYGIACGSAGDPVDYKTIKFVFLQCAGSTNPQHYPCYLVQMCLADCHGIYRQGIGHM